MAELKDARLEQFARNLALGMKQHEAYAKAGYAPDPSRSNAAKKAKTRAVRERVAELQAEQEVERRLVVGAGDDLSGAELAMLAAQMARAQSNPAALAAVAKIVGVADGSLREADASDLPSPQELAGKLSRLSGLDERFWRCMIGPTDFEDADYEDAAKWVSARLKGRPLAALFGTKL